MARKQLGTAPADNNDATTVAYVQANKGTGSGGGNVYVQQSNPGMTSPGLWWQIDASGNLVTLWVETATTTAALPTSGLINRWSGAGVSGVANGGGVFSLSASAGNILLQEPTNPPTFVASGALNNKPALLFNGSTQHIQYSSGDNYNLAQPYTIVGVVRPLDTTSGNTQQIANFNGPEMAIDANNYTTYSGSATVRGGTVAAGGHLLIYGWDSGGATTLNLDGTNIATGNAGTNSMASIRLGSHPNNVWYFNGEIYDICVYNKNLLASANASDLASLKAWARSNYGLTVN